MSLRLRAPWADAPNHYTVVDGEIRCGSIRLSPGASWDSDVWRWDLTALFPGRVSGSGKAETREEAMEGFKAAWERYRATLAPEEWERHLKDQRATEAAVASWDRHHPR